MGIKILKSMTLTSAERRSSFVIGTHGGIFHSDEVVGVAILCMFHKTKKVRIIRTRESKLLNDCNICVDVGGGEFDHHQAGFNLCREENGIPYASAGLVWKEYGEKLICKFLKEYFSEILNMNFALQYVPKEVWETIDKEIISLVDADDNGMAVHEHCFSYVSSYLPLWFDSNYDEQFMKVLKVTISILRQKIRNAIEKHIAMVTIRHKWIGTSNTLGGNCIFTDNILQIPSQTFPWLEAVTKLNELASNDLLKDDTIDFVIFQYPTGGWAAQCVPPSLEKKFDKRIPFPKEWAGQTDKLPKISGVKDAIFCHNGCFFARAKTKTSIIKMCKIAMKKAKN